MQPVGTPKPDVTADPRYQLVVRVAGSRHFQKAPRLREFLLYVCEQTILDHTENLTEQKIGQKIFERSSDYSRADDSIVRVQARQLRLHLAEYFRTEGRDERTVIEIPKGSYVAAFRQAGVPASIDQAHAPGSRLYRLAGVVLLVGLTLGCFALLLENRRLKRTASGTGSTSEPPLLLDAVFDAGRDTTVILSDSSFGMIQGILDGALTLEDYLRPGYPDSVIDGRLSADSARWALSISRRPYTVFSDTLLGERLTRLALSRGWRFSFRYARDIQTRDLAQGNHILLGSRMSNPWVALFEKELTFRSEWDAAADVLYFRDTAAAPGGRQVYSSAGPNGVPGSAFAVAALIPSPADDTGRSRILLLEGTNMEATEAAWDYASEPVQQTELSTRLGDLAGSKGSKTVVEVLLETRALAGSHDNVAVRVVRIH